MRNDQPTKRPRGWLSADPPPYPKADFPPYDPNVKRPVEEGNAVVVVEGPQAGKAWGTVVERLDEERVVVKLADRDWKNRLERERWDQAIPTPCFPGRGLGDPSVVVDALRVACARFPQERIGTIIHRAATRTGQRLEYIGDAELAEALKGLVEGTPLW